MKYGGCAFKVGHVSPTGLHGSAAHWRRTRGKNHFRGRPFVVQKGGEGGEREAGEGGAGTVTVTSFLFELNQKALLSSDSEAVRHSRTRTRRQVLGGAAICGAAICGALTRLREGKSLDGGRDSLQISTSAWYPFSISDASGLPATKDCSAGCVRPSYTRFSEGKGR